MYSSGLLCTSFSLFMCFWRKIIRNYFWEGKWPVRRICPHLFQIHPSTTLSTEPSWQSIKSSSQSHSHKSHHQSPNVWTNLPLSCHDQWLSNTRRTIAVLPLDRVWKMISKFEKKQNLENQWKQIVSLFVFWILPLLKKRFEVKIFVFVSVVTFQDKCAILEWSH